MSLVDDIHFKPYSNIYIYSKNTVLINSSLTILHKVMESKINYISSLNIEHNIQRMHVTLFNILLFCRISLLFVNAYVWGNTILEEYEN